MTINVSDVTVSWIIDRLSEKILPDEERMEEIGLFLEENEEWVEMTDSNDLRIRIRALKSKELHLKLGEHAN